jgi:tRNA (cmo5U34)-methyltransferase
MTAVKDIFDAAASRYDKRRQVVLPCFDDFYGSILRALPFKPEQPIQVLDLGAGTGLVGALILGVFSKASLWAVDVSQKMLAKAEERFAEDGRVTCRVLDYGTDPLPGGFQAVVSALSIHHLSHPDKKLLFRKAWDALEPGGIFINADLVKGATSEAERFYQEAWRDHLEQSGLSRQELDEIYERMTYDITAGLQEQQAWLQGAGFKDVVCLYKYNNFAVYRGGKP